MVAPGEAGKRLPPGEGFGQLWHKRYQVAVASDDPIAVMETWKRDFDAILPGRSRLRAPPRGLDARGAGTVKMELVPGATLSAGIVVTRSSPHSLTLVSSPGHVFAGRNALSVRRSVHPGRCIATVDLVLRASDPLSELALRLGGHRREDRFWRKTLENLAARFGPVGPVARRLDLLDPGLRWRNAANLRFSAPVQLVRRLLHRPGAGG
jgi:hypothetical protein